MSPPFSVEPSSHTTRPTYLPSLFPTHSYFWLGPHIPFSCPVGMAASYTPCTYMHICGQAHIFLFSQHLPSLPHSQGYYWPL